MIFSSYLFLFYFFPFVLFGYYLSPTKLRNFSLALTSFIFYLWGEPHFAIIFLFVCFLNFKLAIKIEGAGNKNGLVTLGIMGNVLLLLYYKYTAFILENINEVLTQDLTIAIPKIIVPIGVSFTTFQSISYLVDVYRGTCKAERNVISYLVYAFLFPHLIAGPIVRYLEIKNEIQKRNESISDVYLGFIRFSIGFAKKVLIAEVLGHTADSIFALPSDQLSGSLAWLGMISYTFQIYFDFSGYSDMAIGLARMFGFKFPENFHYPYNATGFTDFWRKWHTSFGRWMKDYLYIPIGGNKSGKLKEYRNLWIIFLFSGLWHGASWTFVLWGMFHGTFMTIERIAKGSPTIRLFSEKIPTLIKISVTFILIAFSWVLFRSKDLDQSIDFYNALLTGRAASTTKVLGYLTSPYEIWMIVIAAILSFFGPRLVPLFKLDSDRFSYIQFITAFTLFLLSVTALAGRDFSPFIYFQF